MALVALLTAVIALVGLSGPSAAAPPGAPSLVAPADGAAVTAPVTISWSPVTGAGGYHWELSASATFTSVAERNLVLLVGAETTDDVVSGIPPGTWFWRVKAVSRDLEPGSWSAVRRVVVTGPGAGAVGSPALNPPEDSTAFHPLETATFSWTGVPGAVSYVLQESVDPGFPVDTRVRQVGLLGTRERISLSGAHQGSYYARVLAVDAHGVLGAPSTVVTFSVSDTNPMPAAPVPQAPADGTSTRTPLTLRWGHVPNHQDDGYQVQVSSSSSFGTVERTFRTGEDHLLVPTLTPGAKFWRVRSQHGYSGATEAYTAWSSTRSFTVLAQPLAATALTFPVQKFSGGEARGAVDLSGPAPSGGATVTLSASDPALVPELPPSVFVTAGSSSAHILVAPTGFPNSVRGMRVGFVTSPTPVTVTATYAGTSASTTITILPPRLNDTPLQLFPVQATGGTDLLGIVDLEVGCFAGFCDGLAPPGGFPVSLESSSPAAVVPATFTLLTGQGGNSFPISTLPVAERTHVTIWARAGDATAAWTLILTPPPEPDALTLVPTSTDSGSQGQVTIPLSELAGYDQRVAVTSSNPAVAAVPAFATVNAATTLGRFDITTGAVDQPTPVTISVTGRGVTRSATITVYPDLPTLTGFTVSPTSVPGGTSATGTVTLGAPAPAGGVGVSLSSQLPGTAAVPASVTVPAGATSVMFTVSTLAGSGTTTVQLSATLGDVMRFATLTVAQASSVAVSSVSLSPTTVVGGASSTGTVRLSAAAPSGGTAVTLSDNSSAATVPSTVTVAAGATTRTFTVTTTAVTTTTSVTVTAAAGGVTRSANLTVTPPPPAAPTLRTPANGATAVPQPVALDWDDVPGAASYDVVVDDSSAMTSPFVSSSTVSVSQAAVGGLPGRQLWWRVRARNAAGVAGPYSVTRTFTPQGGTVALAAPALVSPATDARFGVGQTVTFDWSDVSGAARYELVVDDQESFGSPALQRTVTASTSSSSSLPAGRLWFRVRAIEASGMTGPWSSSRRFEVR